MDAWPANGSGKVASAHAAWVDGLPAAIRDLQDRWELTLDSPIDSTETSASWVTRALRRDGTRAVLKIGLPHMEAAHEIEGLRFWNGDPTVRVLEADTSLNAMLLEACEPGLSLRQLPEPDQDVVIAGLLKRLWRTPSPPGPFRPLATMTKFWAEETRAATASWSDPPLTNDGLRLFDELSRPSPNDVLLATDLHAGNVLSARREPWLVIDPKPFVGDRAYDATQHLLNCRSRLRADPLGTIRRVADLLNVDHARVRLWVFARAAAEPRANWENGLLAIARVLA